MKNPWARLSIREPFVLPGEKSIIDKYNALHENKIYLDLPPDPFLGNVNSNVVLLNANPGYSEEEVDYYQSNSEFQEENKKNILHQELEYPFYTINPKFKEWKGCRYWTEKLKPLIKSVGSTKLLSEKICCYELIGYHSRKFPYHLPYLKSQDYIKYLIEEAMKREAIVAVMRVRKEWYKLVPNLERYHLHCELNSYRNVIVSPNNLPDGWFDKILNRL